MIVIVKITIMMPQEIRASYLHSAVDVFGCSPFIDRVPDQRIVCGAQCNIWVFCGSQYGCGGCDYKTINYDATLGNDPSKRFGPYGPGCTQSTATLPSFFPM
jgi:hypothetical protein